MIYKHYNQIHLKVHKSQLLWQAIEGLMGLAAFAAVFVFFGVLILSQS